MIRTLVSLLLFVLVAMSVTQSTDSAEPPIANTQSQPAFGKHVLAVFTDVPIQSDISSALNWWAAAEWRADLSFEVEYHSMRGINPTDFDIGKPGLRDLKEVTP